MPPARVLIVDDEEDMLYACRRILSGGEMEVVTESRGEAGLSRLGDGRFDVMLVDLVMPGMGGLEVLDLAKRQSPETEVIVLTGYPTVETAVDAVKKGAFSYITKPFTPEQVRMTVSTALLQKSLREENERLRAYNRRRLERCEMIGESRPFLEALELIHKAAESDCNVLILGETGTGKEMAAQAIHALSDRRDMPFVPLDCGALSETLLESELFGHEKGAFTGAERRREGLLEYASSGTVFLDEIGEMPTRMQVSLLRVIQERHFRRVGGNQLVTTDARILAATNRDPEAEVRNKTFREDLYFRLNVLSIVMPSLRERPDDIPALAAHFIEQFGKKKKTAVVGVEPDALSRLRAYPWPGNVRELQNVIERATLLAEGDRITLASLPKEITGGGGAAPSTPEVSGEFQQQKRDVIEAFERDYLATLMTETGGNVRQAARVAGMPRSSMQRLLKKHGFSSGDFGNGPSREPGPVGEASIPPGDLQP